MAQQQFITSAGSPPDLKDMDAHSNSNSNQGHLTQRSSTTMPAHDSDANNQDAAPQPFVKDTRFWLVIIALLVATFLAALDVTVITVALPTIVNDLHSEEFTWIGAAYTISSTAFVPWSGGLAHVFGRRPIFLVALAFFTVGSAVCGAAHNMDTMIVGRTFQGVGSGGILALVEIVLADIVPLSERSVSPWDRLVLGVYTDSGFCDYIEGFQGAFGAIWALSSAIGPVIGGALAEKNWRWIFFMNLFLDGIVAVIVLTMMNLKTPPGTIKEKMKKMDLLGNAIFIPAMTVFILGLVWGGNVYAWTSAAVLVPLIVGAVGLIAWYFVELRFVEYPTVPFDLLNNRTTIIGFATTTLHSVVAIAVFYYWPSWIQAIQGQSPIRSSVSYFTVTFIVAPFAMVAGGTISATQSYKPQNVIAWVLMTIGSGLLLIVRADTKTATWEALPVVISVGMGLLYAATVFPTLAPLPASLAGHALAFLVFVRSFGQILGITIGSTILTNELGNRLPAEYVSQLPGGIQSAFSAIPGIKDLPEPLRTTVRVAFSDSFRVIWIFLIPVCVIGLAASLAMKTLKLETVTDESWE